MSIKKRQRAGTKMANNNPPQKTTSGIDWLTCTFTSAFAHNHAKRLFLSQCGAAGHPKKWGYRGFNGHQSPDGAISLGWHPKMARGILVCKGSIANQVVKSSLDAPSQVSRLDLQVTHFLDEPCGEYVVRMYEEIKNGRYKTTYITNDEGGQTLYIGSRQSEKFFRIYDAGARHGIGPLGQAWRFELELKKPHAKDVFFELRAAIKGGLPISHIIADTVRHEAFERGIEAPWQQIGLNGHISLQSYKQGRDTRLTWLTTQVKPCLAKLLDQGYSYEILLGFLFDFPGPPGEIPTSTGIAIDKRTTVR